MSDPAVSVIIVAYQSKPVLTRCLAQLKAQTFTDFEIILADNGSLDGAARAAAKADPSLVFLENGQNLGFAEANNRAARAAKGRWLALLNPDAFAEPDWLERLMAATEGHPDTAAFTSLQVAADDPTLLDGAGDAMTLIGLPYRMGYRRPRPASLPAGEVFSPCGAAMLVRRDVFVGMGGFEPRFFAYCEDMDFGYRLRLAGGRTRLVPDAVVAHVGSSTLGARSDFALFHGFRNRLWCFARNTPTILLPVALPLHLMATAALFAGCVVKGEAGPAWRGLIAGLGGLLRMRRERDGRRGNVRDVAAAMTFDPIKAARRGLDVRTP
ncbi:MAG: glycosyltransferase family 2 protein [Caulobacterales bacterium]|nr:glycosyltransferase family 2 protein [Caulobacterales bacterium]